MAVRIGYPRPFASGQLLVCRAVSIDNVDSGRPTAHAAPDVAMIGPGDRSMVSGVRNRLQPEHSTACCAVVSGDPVLGAVAIQSRDRPTNGIPQGQQPLPSVSPPGRVCPPAPPAIALASHPASLHQHGMRVQRQQSARDAPLIDCLDALSAGVGGPSFCMGYRPETSWAKTS